MSDVVAAAATFLDENTLVYVGVEDAAVRLAEAMSLAVRAEVADELTAAVTAQFPAGAASVDTRDGAAVVATIYLAVLKAVQCDFEFGSVKPQQAVADAIAALEYQRRLIFAASSSVEPEASATATRR